MSSSDVQWSSPPDHSASITPDIVAEQRVRWDRFTFWLTSREAFLWRAAAALLVLDLLTTAYGLHLGLEESNPVAAALMERHGILALGFLKGFAVAVAVGGWAVLTRDRRFIVPVCLAVPWFAGTASNALLIASVLVP
jgi:hypothetical protein